MEALRKIGNYQILETLGRGGMGVVYRARHEEFGHEVALKTVLHAKEGLLSGLRREIHALAQIRHPGIVRILDEGLEDGLPWYAMQFVQGQTLRAYALATAEKTTRPEAGCEKTTVQELTRTERPPTESSVTKTRDSKATLAEGASQDGGMPVRLSKFLLHAPLLEVLARLCDALAFLHGEGLVHRDLKPENVLVRLDNSPVLMDFGLASRFGGAKLGRESLDIEAGIAGTAAYMSPEQVRGEHVDARADLYSLDCILYELATGRPPFVGQNIKEVLQQHLYARPAPPSCLVSELLPGLEELILRLLAKSPKDRLGYADDVALQLLAIASAPLQEPTLRPRAYLYRPGFAGRAELMQPLKAAFARVYGPQDFPDARQLVSPMEACPVFFLLEGESGIGKTRILIEAAREASKLQACVLSGECELHTKALSPFKKPLQKIADRCRSLGADETAHLFGHRGKVLEIYEPDLASLPGQALYPAPSELPADAARLRLFSYLSETLQAFSLASGLHGVLLILDDLQNADDITLGWLEFFVRFAQASREHIPILVLGSYRSEEKTESLSKLLAMSGVQLLEAGRLSESAVAAMVGDMLALNPPPALFSQYLARQSEGNPFFVAEYLRAMLHEDMPEGRPSLLWRDAEGAWQVAAATDEKATLEIYESLSLPRSIQDLLGARLDSLSSDAQGLLSAAAVLGRACDLDLLASTAGLNPRQCMEGLRALMQHHVLEIAESDRVWFVHDKLRESAYARIDASQRIGLHGVAAASIETQSMQGKPVDHASLAYHWDKASEAAKARLHAVPAAMEAVARYDISEAERYFCMYLRLAGPPSAETVLVKHEFARSVLQPSGRYHEAEQELQEALSMAEVLGDIRLQIKSYTFLGVLRQNTGRIEEARLGLEKALLLCEQSEEPGSVGEIFQALANLYYDQGQLDTSFGFAEQGLRASRQMGDCKAETFCLMKLADVHSDQGRLDAAEALYRQVLDFAQMSADRGLEAMVFSNLASLRHGQGQIAEARALFEQSLSIFRAIGNRRNEAILLGNLGSLCQTEAQWSEGRDFLQQALLLSRKVGNLRNEAILLVNLAEVSLGEGQKDEAVLILQQALVLARQVAETRLEGLIQISLAKLLKTTALALPDASLAQPGD